MGRPATEFEIGVGDEFDRLTVEAAPRLTPTAGGRRRWVCVVRCECGVVKTTHPSRLVNGTVTSCGCYRREATGRRSRKHGGSGTRLYNIFHGIRKRCYNSKCKAYHRYGGRGIKVCDEWGNFAAFREWALANGYAPRLQIDRRDNNGDYTPTNCRWVRGKQNCRNTSRSRFVTAFGETKTLAEWSDDPRCAVDYGTLRTRLRNGWNPELAIQTQSLR